MFYKWYNIKVQMFSIQHKWGISNGKTTFYKSKFDFKNRKDDKQKLH